MSGWVYVFGYPNKILFYCVCYGLAKMLFPYGYAGVLENIIFVCGGLFPNKFC